MLPRYNHKTRDVEALLFDGTYETGAEIARWFHEVSLSDGVLDVRTQFGPVYAPAGCWIVRDCHTRHLSVVDDREFTARYELIPEAHCEPLDKRSFARLPDRYAWDVV